jgi:competence protein ComEC
VRTAALARIETLYGGQPYETGMMQAILLGETSRMEKVWTEHFRATGTYHALVISGAHVAALVAPLLLVFRWLSISAGLQLLLATALAWFYALLAGFDPPVARAAAGLTLFALARCVYRRVRLMNALAAVTLLFLILDPEQLFEASFQLSFLSVGFIAALGVPLLDRTSRPLAKALPDLADTGKDTHLEPRTAQFRVELRLLAETIALWTRLPAAVCRQLIRWPTQAGVMVYEAAIISAIVQLGLAAPMAIYFHRVSFTGISANVLIGLPMLFVVPAGMLAVATGWSVPAAAAASLLHWSRQIVEWHAAQEPVWRIPAPPAWLIVSIAAALVAAALVQQAHRFWRLVAMTAVVGLTLLLLRHPFAPQIRHGELTLTAFDVGQGDSLWLTLPDGKLLVMDGGGIPAFGAVKPRLDIGDDVVSPALWSRSVRHVDVMALSHAHADHIGGLPALVRNFRPQELWVGAIPKLDVPGVRIRTLRRGDAFRFGGAEFEALAPARDFEAGPKPHNNDSLVLRVRYGRHAFLLSGDIERSVENELLDEQVLTGAAVLKVAHHGSKTSTQDRLLDAVRPAFAVISSGASNSYGHPHPDVLQRLQERRIGVLRTDELGEITLHSNGRRLGVETEAWRPPRFALYSAF